MSQSVMLSARLVRSVLVVVLAVAMSLGALSAPAVAAPAAPGNLSSTDSLFPVLSWSHIDGATQYQLELSKTADASQIFGGTRTTVNRQYVATEPLPWTAGTPLYWRVAVQAPQVGAWSGWTPVTRSSAYAAPHVTSPTPGQAPFDQPAHPATLSWDPVEGAQEYEVEISQDENFTDPALITTKRTVSTTYVVSDPQVATTYWFRVRARISTNSFAADAIYTDRSEPVSYRVTDLSAAERLSPVLDTSVVDDSVFDWKPVDGARTYDLQVATDPSFGSIVHQVTGVTGTSYARPRTLDNDTYWWRVRATDVAGNVQAWTTRPTWRFDRAWDNLPMPSYPANPADVNPATPNDADAGVSVGDPFYYEWKPVRFASMYKLEVATDENFSSIVGTCYTRNTTYTPGSEATSCMPGAERTYWWRVSAMDQHRSTVWNTLEFPTTSQNVFNDARFTYQPSRVTPISPGSGATVDVPTMKWQPLAGAAKYHVEIVSLANGTKVAEADTAATSYTPDQLLTPGNYRWDVYAISEDGRKGSALLPVSQPTFSVVAPPAAVATTPDVLAPTSGAFRRFPALSWKRVEGATHYKVRVRAGSIGGWSVLAPDYKNPAATDTGTDFLAPGAYEWSVDAFTPTGIMTSGIIGRFDIADPAAVTGEVNALSMGAANAGQTCTGFECNDLRQTPVMTWDPKPDTGYYLLWVTRNANLANKVPPQELGVSNNPIKVYNTTWTPTTALQDSTALLGYFWAVQPCTAAGKCASNPVPHNSFEKASNPIESLSPGAIVGTPGPAPLVADDVTLTWRDYLDTNATAAQGSSQLVTQSGQEAREYEVWVSADPTFASASLLDEEIVDQRQFTSFDTTYPEGNIYWQVRAIDGSGNPLPWSDVRVFKKESPTPVLDPTSGVLPAAPVLSWQPLRFAASYQLEITPAGSTTPVITTSSNQVKWSPTTTAQSLAPGTYKWWVRRVDAKGRFGGWSTPSNITVGGAPVTLVAPSNGGAVAPRDSLFTWSPENRAASYKVTLVAPSGNQTTQNTKATSWAPLSVLTAGTWSWYVETRDSADKVIARSATQTFSVTADLAATSAPRLDGSGQLDTVLTAQPPVWNHQPDSVTYQWLSWSKPIGDGSLSYLITAADLGQHITLRATAKKLGYPDVTTTSNGITVVQGAAPVATTPPTITGSGLVGETLTGNPPSWSAGDVTMTYRWLVAGRSVATASTYVPTAADMGKDVTFEVTGNRPKYASAIVTSAPVMIAAGGALQATVQPTIVGTAQPGTALRAESGTWSQPSASFTYQWLRTGAPIPGATSSVYTLTPLDAGKDVSVTVLASKTGFADGAATAPSVFVAKLTSTTVGTLSATTIKKGKTVKVGLTVTVPGVPGPSGYVKIQDGVKTLKKFILDPFRKGVMTVKISTKKLKPGRHKIKVVFLGNASTDMSKSKVTRLIVTRR